MRKITVLFVALLTLSIGFGQGIEDFENLPTETQTSYLERTWTGTDAVEWNAIGARTDQSLDGRAICFGNTSHGDRSVTSPIYTGGMGELTFDYVRGFTGTNARALEVWVNGAQIGGQITVDNTSNDVVTYNEIIEIEGDVVLEIRSVGAAQVIVDNISWTAFTSGGGEPGCTDLGILSTTPGSVCDEGAITLMATAATDNLFWYDADVDGNLVGNGNEFTTPVLTETTSYWVSEFLLGAGSQVVTGQAKQEPFAASTGTAPSNPGWGLIFTATESFILDDVEVFVTGAAGDLVINLTDMAQNVIETTTIAVPGGDGGTPTPVVLPLGFNIQPGEYRLVAMGGSPAMVRDFSPAFPYEVSTVATVTTGALGSGTNNAYYYFYNWTISVPEIECESDRVEVIATVNETISIEVDSSVNEICEGETSELTVTSANTDYEYTWEPGALTGNTITVEPAQTTTYVVTAVDPNTGCTTEESITVVVNLVPTELVITPEAAEICVDSTIMLSAGAPGGGDIVEDFEAPANDWTTVDNSSGTSAAWTLVQSPHLAAGISSNDASQFYFSNSDSQGSGSTVDTELISSSFDLTWSTAASISFYHYYRHVSTVGAVEVSIDGGVTYENLVSYTATQGTADTFSFVTLSLDDYIGNSDVRVRFHYTGGWGWYWGIDNVTISRTTSGEITWAPFTDLYLDEEATLPYDGSPADVVYMNASAAGNVTYTATLTVGTCGEVTEDVIISVIETLDAPEGDDEQFFDAGETLADLDVTGINLTWYSDEDGMNEIPDTTELVDATTYYVSQSSGNCESELLAITVFMNLGVNDSAIEGFVFYPNPVTNALNLKAVNSIDEVKFFNALGQLVLNQKVGVNTTTLDISELATGTYFMEVTSQDKTAVYQVIKK